MVLNDAGTIGLSLNGKSFPATEPTTAKSATWVLVNYFNEGLHGHPMHLHGQPQLVIAKDGIPLDRALRATPSTSPRASATRCWYDATDPGVWAWHCHILTHAESDNGMFGMVTALIVQDPEAS